MHAHSKNLGDAFNKSHFAASTIQKWGRCLRKVFLLFLRTALQGELFFRLLYLKGMYFFGNFTQRKLRADLLNE